MSEFLCKCCLLLHLLKNPSPTLYFNYTPPAPWKEALLFQLIILGQILMSRLNFIKGKFLDMIASYTSTGRWSPLFIKKLILWRQYFRLTQIVTSQLSKPKQSWISPTFKSFCIYVYFLGKYGDSKYSLGQFTVQLRMPPHPPTNKKICILPILQFFSSF